MNELPGNINEYTDRHRRLIGEFLRRNHPRLAHDLALGLDVTLGLPNLMAGFKTEECDLVGLIARSHGDPLRKHFKYIEAKFDLRDFNRTHIVFLMAMLRIADYAQLQASRAPPLRALVHPVESPISRQEWRVHASIKNITRTHDDPFAIFIDANPLSVSDYLRLNEWLDGLQSEIDNCWAVFGEVYGRQTENGLSNLGFFSASSTVLFIREGTPARIYSRENKI
nr:hypothetical protein [Lichenibacterium sp. 6Y81]